MARVRTDVVGIKQLVVRLDQLPGDISRAAQRAVDEELLDLGVDIAGRAPVDTGELRDSVEVDEGVVRVTADHAAPVELGTYKMRAQPYVQPALVGFEKRLADRIAKEIKKELS